MTRGEWFGNMTPPDPTRIVDVLPATCPINTDVAALAIPGMLWCSASQKRVNPHRSACCARSAVFRYASAIVPPVRTGAKSRMENRATYSWMFGVAYGRRTLLDASFLAPCQPDHRVSQV